MTDTCMGPYTSERSNMRMKYSRFLTADSQGRNSVSFVRKRVEFRARVTLTSLALIRTRVRSQSVQPFIQNSQKSNIGASTHRLCFSHFYLYNLQWDCFYNHIFLQLNVMKKLSLHNLFGMSLVSIRSNGNVFFRNTAAAKCLRLYLKCPL